MTKPGLNSLPDDLLFPIIQDLETAGDVARVSASCRRLNRFVKNEGWRVFARARFPSFDLPSTTPWGWDRIADSLTWQSRAWDRRSIVFTYYEPSGPRPSRRRGPSAPRRVSKRPYQPVLDAHLDLETGEELVAWGAGENLVARRRRKGKQGQASESVWRSWDGKAAAYAAGTGDVKALKIVRNPLGFDGGLGLLAGRENGDLVLHSADPSRFGEVLSTLEASPEDEDATDSPESSMMAPGAIQSLDLRGHRHVAAAINKGVLLYDLPQEEAAVISPSAYFDLRDHVEEGSAVLLQRAKWMADDMLALAFKSRTTPLRCLQLTPTGFEIMAASKCRAAESTVTGQPVHICPTSIEPVRMSSGGPAMLLSAWRDGTCRLQDLRTPSPFDAVYKDNINAWPAFDAVYQDNVNPGPAFETLLPFGAERFAAAGLTGSTVKIFDFRQPKAYHHTAGLPCPPRRIRPYPPPSQPFSAAPAERGPGVAPAPRCDHGRSGRRCLWHHLSRDVYYRPNCSLFYAHMLPPSARGQGVWSLARPADLSPYFYVGCPDGVVEARLEDILGGGGQQRDATYSFYPARGDDGGGDACADIGYHATPLRTAIIETGDGLAHAENDRAIRLPRMRPMFEDGPGRDVPRQWREMHRLDGAFQHDGDFQGWRDVPEGDEEEEEDDEVNGLAEGVEELGV